MINRELINPQSIVVVGGSNNVHKPGGRIVRNLLDGKYKGELCVVNAKETDVQGVKSYPSVHDIPETELAIISIPRYRLRVSPRRNRLRSRKSFYPLLPGQQIGRAHV